MKCKSFIKPLDLNTNFRKFKGQVTTLHDTIGMQSAKSNP